MDENNYDEEIGNNISEERAVYIRTFIHFVYPNTQLYAKKSKGYSKCQDKSLTWTSIGAAMTPALTGLQAEKLFHRLREKFGKERKKVKMSMPRSGAGANTSTYQSTWIFYNDLLFLADHIIARRTTSNFQRPAVQLQSSTVLQSKQSPFSPIWNPDLNSLNSSPSSSLDSEINYTTGSNETEEKECKIKDASESTASTAILKTIAASIQPVKLVPPKDPVKKRKRDSEKTDDILSQSSKDISYLATSLGTALEKFGSSQPLQLTSHPERRNMSSDIEAMLGFIAVGLNKVPEEKQMSCVMDVMTIVQEYTTQ